MNLGMNSRTRRVILAGLAGGPISITDLSDCTGLSSVTVRNALAALAEEGVAESARGSSRGGRPTLMWQLKKTVLAASARAPKLRKCLCCERQFFSPHAGVRLCAQCKTDAARSSAGLFDHHVHIHT